MANKVKRSFRIRAYPTQPQRVELLAWFEASRWLWNRALFMRSEAYKRDKTCITGVGISRMLTQFKKSREWLLAVPATCFTQTLRDQDTAFRNFFAKRAKYPKFKPRAHTGALRFQAVSQAKWLAGTMSLPKIGSIRLAEGLPDVACPDTVTLKLESDGRWYVSFSAEVEVALLPVTASVVGVDLGITHFAVLSSTGEKIENPKRLRARMRYLKQQQRCLARKKVGSKRRERQRLRVARAHSAVRNQRRYAIHALTTRLVRENQIIAVESLNVRGMVKNHHLAGALHDASFGEIKRQLTYKTAWYGRTLVEVSQWFPSSKTCSCCGHKLDELNLSQREWTCPKCGAVHDRDRNASINILQEGLRLLDGREGRDLRIDGGAVSPPREMRTEEVHAKGRS